MTDVRALRHQLRAASFCPIPLYGKSPPEYGKNNSKKGLRAWQLLHEVTAEQIELWAKTWPDANNTGCLTRHMPTLDADILDPDAATAIEAVVRERYEEAGNILIRIGLPPKRAIPFRTEEPFKKIVVNVIAPNAKADAKPEKVEFLADGEQVVVDGTHPDTGKPYRWHGGELGKIRLEDLPYIREAEARQLVDDLVELLIRDFGYKRAPTRPQKSKQNGAGQRGESDWQYLFDNIREGRELHDSLRDLAAKMITAGTNSGAAIHQLRALMDASTATKDERWRARVGEIPRAVDSAVAKYGRSSSGSPAEPAPPAEPITEHPPAEPITKQSAEQTIAVFKRWLVLSSTTPVYAMLGAVAANLLDGDPVWFGLIGPPSSAKTELLNSITGLPHVVQAATITPSGLLSGTPKKQHDAGARGGLLRQIGSFGVIILKDFGSVLSMHAETRAEVLAALREVYDGSWTRHLGSAGGKSLAWKGKVAVLFGATEVIDAHHSVIGAMGDRFLLSRLKPVPGRKQFARALKHAGRGMDEMRKELSVAVKKLFAKRRPQAAEINADEAATIGKAIALAVRLRGAVARDYRSRDIEAIYQAEGTARIGLALERLLAGLDTLGVDRQKALRIVTEVALDSVPPLRRRAYECVCKDRNVETAKVAIAPHLPTNTTRRILEDLAAHGLIVRRSQGPGNPNLWDKSKWEEDEEGQEDADTEEDGAAAKED
jgi:hypothetical protein